MSPRGIKSDDAALSQDEPEFCINIPWKLILTGGVCPARNKTLFTFIFIANLAISALLMNELVSALRDLILVVNRLRLAFLVNLKKVCL